jgi:methylamine dehydrogenase light chain
MSGRMDRITARLTRGLARRTSRRSFLGALGATLVGGAAGPLLPVARAEGPAREPLPGEPAPDTPEGNPDDCNYWRYCAIDGFLSSCCGGRHNACPPGTSMSPITWLGTCRNPLDGKDYVISYNDCCGKDACGRCFCNRNEGDKPIYYTHKNNDLNWCTGAPSMIYNSTVAVIVGVATRKG